MSVTQLVGEKYHPVNNLQYPAAKPSCIGVMDNTNIKAPFKPIRVVGKSNPYFSTNKDKQIKIKKPD